MKIILIFIFFLALITCSPFDNLKEEILKKREELGQQVLDCIINNSTTSEELKKKKEENKNGIKLTTFYSFKNLDEKDREIIKNCRNQFITQIKKNILYKFKK